MGIFLSHTTALQVLREWGVWQQLARARGSDPELPATAPTAKDLAELSLRVPPLRTLDRPLHVLASSVRPGPRATGCVVHRSDAKLPRGSAIPLAEGVCCSSPELVVVQMAPQLTDLELIVLLSELMGVYAIAPGSEDGMLQRDEPLTDPERIRAFLAELGPRTGTRRVLRALGLACVRSGSPRETKTALRLSLRAGLGGYGLTVLSMNERVEVRRIRDAMSSGVRKPDLLVAAPRRSGGATREHRVVALEYLGGRHEEPARMREDVNRSNELKAMGITEYQIRREHYGDLDYMDGLVAAMRRELGQPRIGMTRAEARRRRELRQRLYEELELIDGITWKGREREAARSARMDDGATRDPSWEVVPVEAYGLD